MTTVTLLLIVITFITPSNGRHIPKQPETLDLLIFGQTKMHQQQLQQQQIIRLDSGVPFIMTIKREGRSLLLLNGKRGKRSFPDDWSQDELDKFNKWKKMKKRLTKIMMEREEEEKTKKLLRNYNVKQQKAVKTAKKDEKNKDHFSKKKPEKSQEDWRKEERIPTQEDETEVTSSLSSSSLLLPDHHQPVLTTTEPTRDQEAPVVGRLPRGRMGVFIHSGMDVFERIQQQQQQQGNNNAARIQNEYRTLTTTLSSYTQSSLNSSLLMSGDNNENVSKMPDYLSYDENNGIWIKINKGHLQETQEIQEEVEARQSLSRQKRFFLPSSLLLRGLQLPSIFIKFLSLFAPKPK